MVILAPIKPMVIQYFLVLAAFLLRFTNNPVLLERKKNVLFSVQDFCYAYNSFAQLHTNLSFCAEPSRADFNKELL